LRSVRRRPSGLFLVVAVHYLDPVLEGDTVEDLGDELVAVEAPPTFLGGGTCQRK